MFVATACLVVCVFVNMCMCVDVCAFVCVWFSIAVRGCAMVFVCECFMLVWLLVGLHACVYVRSPGCAYDCLVVLWGLVAFVIVYDCACAFACICVCLCSRWFVMLLNAYVVVCVSCVVVCVVVYNDVYVCLRACGFD